MSVQVQHGTPEDELRRFREDYGRDAYGAGSKILERLQPPTTLGLNEARLPALKNELARPELTRLVRVLNEGCITSSPTPQELQRLDLDSQLMTLVRGDTHNYFKEAITEIWRSFAESFQSGILLLPAYSNLCIPGDRLIIPDSRGLNLFSLPIKDLAAIFNITDRSEAMVALKTVLQFAFLHRIYSWQEMHKRDHSFEKTRQILSTRGSASTPEVIINTGIASGILHTLDSFMVLEQLTRAKLNIESIPNDVRQRMAIAHTDFLTPMLGINFMGFSRLLDILVDTRNPAATAFSQKWLMDPLSCGAMVMALDVEMGGSYFNRYHSDRFVLREMKDPTSGTVTPILDYASFTSAELQGMKSRGAIFGCPAAEINRTFIPKLLEWYLAVVPG